MGASNFGCDECFSLLFTLLDSMETWNFRRKKNYTVIQWNFLGIFTLLTLSYFYSAHILVCMYIFMPIFSCLICTCPPFEFFFVLKYLEFSL